MVDTMSRRTNYGASLSQTHRDITDDRYRDLRRPRKVRFFSNGDRYFKGKKLYITPHRYLGFSDLLSDLTGKLPGSVQLPYGVRQVFTPTGGTRIRDIEQLLDGQDYVCAGFEPFKAIQYGKHDLEPWTNDPTGQDVRDPRKQAHHNKNNHLPSTSDQFPTGAFRPYYNRGLYGGFNPNRHYRHMYPYGRGQKPQIFPGKNYLSQSEDAYNKPKVVTIVRNGERPRNIVKLLLNKRSVQSFEQLMSDISESFGPKWKNDRVRKLFTLRGKDVLSVSDFFRNDDLFIAVGTDSLTVSDVVDILKEVAPDSPQAKTYRRDWERQKKKKREVEKSGDAPEGEGDDKRDSGFGEIESQREDEEFIYVPQKQETNRARKKKPKDQKDENLNDREKQIVSRLDAEQQKAVDEDRVRTRKRIQKIQDAEKRALDEERRKRGLVPQKGSQDTYRKILEEREKERERQRELGEERARKRREREERKKQAEERKEGDEDEEERKRDERKRRQEEKKKREEEKRREEERKEEERRAEERKAEERRAEDEREEEERREREKQMNDEMKREEQQKRSEEEQKRKEEKRKQDEEKRKQDEEERRKEEERKRDEEKQKEIQRRRDEEKKIKGANSARITAPDQSKSQKEEEAKDSGVGDEVGSNKDLKKESSKGQRKSQDEGKSVSVSPKRRSSKKDNVMSSADKRKIKDSVKDKENQNVEDDNNNKVRPVEKKDHGPRRKSIRTTKTKIERQVSNADRVLDKYDMGKVMGDGNFAVVKACKLKNTNNEYAMKVIDKSKLRGKEHMIENEILIMKRCTHPNIVQLKEEFETKEEIYLIMELVKGGDLFDAITQSVKFNEKDSAHMVRDLTNALYYLHSRHVVHRDLKPENLLVQRTRDGSMTLKLADFGLAMDVKEPIYTVCGTPTYVAPEILSEIGYGLEVDMWALGVISYILLCGFPPFRSPDRNQTELFEYIKAGEYEFLSPYWDGISRSAKDLIENLLIVDRRRRYKAIDVLTHPWVITLANTLDTPTNMAEHRLNLRTELESQAKVAWDTYRLQYKL